ncbi:NifU family protein [Gangjinia marincola]|uniref:NifU family protein n=1 Tax=Gangjinia marincola TaxID=578463 RepID=A0ABP3XQE1_9FLAO
MSDFTVEAKETNHSSIYKFEANQFLTKHVNYEFANIDEAKNSPLAQQLFYLPFVKKVYIAENFVAIEKYDIVTWDDVKEEVRDQIQDYLNQGGEVVNDEKTPKKIPVTVYAESTPNPSTMKFVTNKKIVLQSVEFRNIDEAKHAPLAQELFHFPFIKSVFLDENYISITKYDVAEWNDITIEIRTFIKSFIEEGKTILDENHVNPQQTLAQPTEEGSPFEGKSIEEYDDVSKKIIAILDEYIKPAVASDGGNILFKSYESETKKVNVILQGACSGCPSSTITLKNGIEQMLKEMLHGHVETVEAING